ncbi:hypothetical protein AAVH_34898 [Aphelenchoides avenae]|nr:hypothetical protein AAVH_34898 [Aphelenchus avenae]
MGTVRCPELERIIEDLRRELAKERALRTSAETEVTTLNRRVESLEQDLARTEEQLTIALQNWRPVWSRHYGEGD